jgi:peptidoglycan hydrolase-like protein with peptidoglycan-binding domain
MSRPCRARDAVRPRRLRVAVIVAALALAAALVAAPAAGAQTSPPAPAPVPAPSPAPPAPPAPVAGTMRLVLQRVGGRPLFALAGRRIVVRGIVEPYVGGQQVKLSFYESGRKIAVKQVAVAAVGDGAGQFHVGFATPSGLVQVRGAHYATAQQGAFSARSQPVHVVAANLGPGSQGQSVRLLQSELDELHYAVPLSGVFDEGTGRALIAYRKMTGLARIAYAGSQVLELLQRGAGGFHVRYARDGRHVEADLTRQVLAEIEPGGRVHAIYTMSSGKPSTPTVIGHFNVYEKTPGVNSEGMVDSNYFIRGYAIHGYAEVPTYAASHGCLRVPIPDAPAIFAWVRTGTPVDVYNEGGGGSGDVRSNAGP